MQIYFGARKKRNVSSFHDFPWLHMSELTFFCYEALSRSFCIVRDWKCAKLWLKSLDWKFGITREMWRRSFISKDKTARSNFLIPIIWVLKNWHVAPFMCHVCNECLEIPVIIITINGQLETIHILRRQATSVDYFVCPCVRTPVWYVFTYVYNVMNEKYLFGN